MWTRLLLLCILFSLSIIVPSQGYSCSIPADSPYLWPEEIFLECIDDAVLAVFESMEINKNDGESVFQFNVIETLIGSTKIFTRLKIKGTFHRGSLKGSFDNVMCGRGPEGNPAVEGTYLLITAPNQIHPLSYHMITSRGDRLLGQVREYARKSDRKTKCEKLRLEWEKDKKGKKWHG